MKKSRALYSQNQVQQESKEKKRQPVPVIKFLFELLPTFVETSKNHPTVCVREKVDICRVKEKQFVSLVHVSVYAILEFRTSDLPVTAKTAAP